MTDMVTDVIGDDATVSPAHSFSCWLLASMSIGIFVHGLVVEQTCPRQRLSLCSSCPRSARLFGASCFSLRCASLLTLALLSAAHQSGMRTIGDVGTHACQLGARPAAFRFECRAAKGCGHRARGKLLLTWRAAPPKRRLFTKTRSKMTFSQFYAGFQPPPVVPEADP